MLKSKLFIAAVVLALLAASCADPADTPPSLYFPRTRMAMILNRLPGSLTRTHRRLRLWSAMKRRIGCIRCWTNCRTSIVQ
jgi:hypothetical protein